MAETARLIIPVWGEAYVAEVLSITLPAVLAPGNLPALSGMFDVEVVIVTETRLFDLIRSSRCFHVVEEICSVRLVPLDDLLTSVFTDYGMVLTYALFRGFADLGARMTETYLMLLNADFVISDGSLRHLGKLMQEGKRVIHAPSFRVVAEDVDPELRALVDRESCTLSLGSRQLAKLALANKHPTVKARTINQRICHLEWMDQFYWYVDDDTLIGYQSPMALAAVKPERAVDRPVNFWDYGFLPEAAPAAELHFISDSDDFFMIEPQSRDTGKEMIRVGWTSFDELARTESLRSTQEHRHSGKQLLKIHAADLPPGIDAVIEESRAFMAELYGRLTPAAVPHLDHPLLSRWFEEAGQRRYGVPDATPHEGDHGAAPPASAMEMTSGRGLMQSVLKALQGFYGQVFGLPPKVGKFHPLWAEVAPINEKLTAWQSTPAVNVLRLGPGDWRMAVRRANCGGRASDAQGPAFENVSYDICVCELAMEEMADLTRIYAALRPLMKSGGHVLFTVTKTANPLDSVELFLNCCDLPDIDVSQINFRGTVVLYLLRALYKPAMRPIATRALARGLLLCALFGIAPVVWLANAWAARRDPSIFSATWTSLTVEFSVKRRRGPLPSTHSSCAETDGAAV